MSAPPVGRNAAAPIGVFDSGVGGLSVLREVQAALPHEDVLYYADSANCPYGERPPADIEALTLTALRWLRAQGCKLVVIACNTACACSLSAVRAVMAAQGDGDVQIVGLVPALKPAVLHTRSRVVVVFATPVTLGGSLLAEVIEKHARPAGVTVLPAFDARLVPLVEAGEAESLEARRVLRETLTPLIEAGADSLILGCTHYPYLAPAIRAEFGGRFALYDSGAGVAKRVASLLSGAGLLHPGEAAGTVRLYTSGTADAVAPVVRQLMGRPVPVRSLGASTRRSPGAAAVAAGELRP
ncbi:glutamate racemase [Deinococcus sp.]|uniref:glutamate racemase n=1 Tax=Deinococcus sp. TaxID=47478 RepID=UPI003CC51982